MGKISVSISDELEEKLRQKAIKEFGIKKGYLSQAVIKALELWLKEP
jgi:hypothetical protein